MTPYMSNTTEQAKNSQAKINGEIYDETQFNCDMNQSNESNT